MKLPLKQLRMQANNGMPETKLLAGESLSQDELALRLGISQGQVSRYESAPESIPFDLAFAWCRACGFSVEDAMRLNSMPEGVGVNPGSPYSELHANLELLRQYASSGPELSPDLPVPSTTPESFARRIEAWRQKPSVLITGRFDSGKTRIANALLGSENLPSQYTPTTSIVTFVRHIEERPEWQKEDIWVMKKGFEPARWADRKHCEQFRIVAGGFETLKRYGVKESEGEKEGAKAALVYIDAPLLRACTLIDVPGFQDDENDAQLATNSASLADVVIYTSPAKGFIDQADFLHLSQLLRTITPLNPAGETTRLANFFLVATHADPSIADPQVDHILDRGAERLHKHFAASLFAPDAAAERRLSQRDVRNRIYTFWYESPKRRERLENGLHHTLTTLVPEAFRAQIDFEIKELKAKTRTDLRKKIEAYENALVEMDAARSNLKQLRDDLPRHKADIALNKVAFRKEVDKLRESTRNFITAELEPVLAIPEIESFIRKNFDKDKKDAERDAIPRLLEQIQDRLERQLKKDAETLTPLIEKYLERYEATLESVKGPQFGGFEAIPFDAKGAFAGGLAAAGTLGALTFWASTVGNLGGYILVAKLASVLSMAGLGVGSTALVTFVAAIGGPVTLAVGLASILALGAWSLTGEDWKSRLAKKIAKTLQEKGFVSNIREKSDAFWDSTWSAFEKGADAIEEKFAEYITKNEDLLKGNSKEKLQAAIDSLEDLRDFFGGIPWRAPA